VFEVSGKDWGADDATGPPTGEVQRMPRVSATALRVPSAYVGAMPHAGILPLTAHYGSELIRLRK